MMDKTELIHEIYWSNAAIPGVFYSKENINLWKWFSIMGMAETLFIVGGRS